MMILMYTVSYDIYLIFFFFNDTATTEIYTLSLHDALPISRSFNTMASVGLGLRLQTPIGPIRLDIGKGRSEEHTSELQSRQYLVCRLLLEKKKTHKYHLYIPIIET